MSEDVNHEVYGGIDGQMILARASPSQHPSRRSKTSACLVGAGRWQAKVGGSSRRQRRSEDCLDGADFSEGEASVEVWLTKRPGERWLILKVTDASTARTCSMATKHRSNDREFW